MTSGLNPKDDADAVVSNDFATFSNPGYGLDAERAGNVPPPLTDSIAMSPNVNTGYEMQAASNPSYETVVEKQGIELEPKMETPIDHEYDTVKEKKEPMEVTPQNEYMEISATKEKQPAPGTPPDPHTYESLKWESFNEPEYDNFSDGKLTLNMNHSDDGATA